MSGQVRGLRYNKEELEQKLDEVINGRKGNVDSKRYIRKNGDIGRYTPWPDGEIVKEMYFHYRIGKYRFLVCPRSVGGKCKICEEGFNIIKEGKKIGNEEERRRVCMEGGKLLSVFTPVLPIHIKSRETSKLVLVDSLNVPRSKTSTKENEYLKLMEWLKDPAYGNITDIKDGNDIKFNSRMAGGGQHQYELWTLEIRPKSPLADTPDKAAEILNAVPNLEDVYKVLSCDDTVKIYNEIIEEVSFPTEDTRPEPPPMNEKDEEELLNETVGLKK